MVRRLSCVFASVIALGTTFGAVAFGDDTVPGDLADWGRLLDPSGDCKVSLDIERDRLKIKVPGTPHVLSAEQPTLPMNAPRVVRRIRGDFTAEVRVLGRLEPGESKTTMYDPYHGAGLIVWQDPGNYLRLERAVGTVEGRPYAYLNFELRADGQLAMSRGITIEGGPLFLRLSRRGQEFTAWSSYDGHRWVPLPRVDAMLNERVEVGVVAINSSGRALSAKLEHLHVDDPEGSKARDY